MKIVITQNSINGIKTSPTAEELVKSTPKDFHATRMARNPLFCDFRSTHNQLNLKEAKNGYK